MAQTSQRAAMKPCNSNSETHLQDDLLRGFEERWFAPNRSAYRLRSVSFGRRLFFYS